MNLLYLRFVLEVASAGSINKAAEKLCIDQPNLSRSIRELETSLGVSLFERSSKGMKLTPDGEVFVGYARSILRQIDTLETMFRDGLTHKKRFSISVPRASYISAAFSSFSLLLGKEPTVEVFYKETNALRAIRNILEEDYKLGIVRYAENYDKYYKNMLDEKGLTYELVTEFHYMLIMAKKSPLAQKTDIRFSDLTEQIEIAHADPYVPSLPLSEVRKKELPEMNRRIFVFERGSQFELLAKNTDTFMWVSHVPEDTCRRFGLVQRNCTENTKVYKDVLIHRKEYELSDLDQAFLSELCRVKQENFIMM